MTIDDQHIMTSNLSHQTQVFLTVSVLLWVLSSITLNYVSTYPCNYSGHVMGLLEETWTYADCWREVRPSEKYLELCGNEEQIWQDGFVVVGWSVRKLATFFVLCSLVQSFYCQRYMFTLHHKPMCLLTFPMTVWLHCHRVPIHFPVQSVPPEHILWTALYGFLK